MSSHRERKSRGAEETFHEDILEVARIRHVLVGQAEEVCEGLARTRTPGRTVTLKVRYADSPVSRSPGWYRPICCRRSSRYRSSTPAEEIRPEARPTRVTLRAESGMSVVAWRAAAASLVLHATAHAGDVVVLPPGEPVSGRLR